MSDRTCSIEGCDAAHYGRGWCQKHYAKWYNSQPRISAASCILAGCERPAKARGWCGMHYRRWLRHGDPTITTKPASAPERFWAKVDKTGTCWLWMGATSHKGYGKFSPKRGERQGNVHRYAYELLVGPIPDGMYVDHTCYVRHCVNPAHLQVVTPQRNSENRAGAMRSSSTGVRGVWLDKRRGLYEASVTVNWTKHFIGRFATVQEAESAVIEARNRLMTNNLQDRRIA